MKVALSVVIPCYNEADTVGRALVETVRAFNAYHRPFEVIIVDDGSTDETAKIVENLQRQESRIRLIRLAENAGKGGAVKAGVLAAEGEWVIFFDADLSVMPAAFHTFLPFLDAYDVLIGSRRVVGSRIIDPQPWHRDSIGRLFNLFVRLALRLPYRDTQCGFKAFRLSACRPLFEALRTAGWSFDVELLSEAKNAVSASKNCPSNGATVPGPASASTIAGTFFGSSSRRGFGSSRSGAISWLALAKNAIRNALDSLFALAYTAGTSAVENVRNPSLSAVLTTEEWLEIMQKIDPGAPPGVPWVLIESLILAQDECWRRV